MDPESNVRIDSRRLREWSGLRPWRNLALLACDYACVASVAAAVIWLHLNRVFFGLHWLCEAGAIGLGVFVIGILQHRIALMGHEASHYMLLSNRVWNDVLAEMLVFYPLFSSIELYRRRHMGHHLHPNDPMHDPNLFGGKWERIWALFPMSKKMFICRHYLMFFWPPFVLRNLMDLFLVLAVGSGEKNKPSQPGWLSPKVLGIGYFVVIVCLTLLQWWKGRSSPLLIGGCYGVAVIGWWLLPERSFSIEPSQAGKKKLAGALRLTFYTLLIAMLGVLTEWFGDIVIEAFLLLWILPLIYVLPYLMLLREIYQHVNAGTGDINNSRIMHAGPFTRWALLGYGNDFHLIHHLYPNIPHDRLARVHEALMRESPSYQRQVQETHGLIFTGPLGKSLLDSLAE